MAETQNIQNNENANINNLQDKIIIPKSSALVNFEQRDRERCESFSTYVTDTMDDYIAQCRNARCKHCITKCPVREFNLIHNKNATCVIPEAKLKADMYKKGIMTSDVLEKMSYDVLQKLIDICDGVRDLKILHDVILDCKREFYPNITKNVNVNVDTTNTAEMVLKNIFANEVISDRLRMIEKQKAEKERKILAENESAMIENKDEHQSESVNNVAEVSDEIKIEEPENETNQEKQI